MEFNKIKLSAKPSGMFSDEIVITINKETPTFEETEKIAKFIEKAPEMLEMLKKIQSETDPHGNSKRCNEIQQLIKEATEL
jgi:hypothetical protein